MKKYLFYILGGAAVLVGSLSSCTKDLDRRPTNDVTSEVVYSTPQGYKQSLAKVYGSFALTGNTGPAGSGDIRGIDEGTSDFLRLYWKAQELSTDEAVVAWNDVGIQDFHNMNWSSSNQMLNGVYNRAYYQITLANAFIAESTDDKINGRGFSATDAEDIRKYRAEARFLRAFQYWVIMDLFGNVPFVTTISSDPPQQKSRQEIFQFIESELKAIEGELNTARKAGNEYGRADQAAAWALLARLYLNAKVYTGTERYTDAVTYSKKVIEAGYQLEGDYKNLFLADNHLRKNEIILTINYDGTRTKNYGGMTFLIHASVGGDMNADLFGIGKSGGWGGVRSTKSLPLLFPDQTGAADKRAMFAQTKMEIDDVSSFKDGLAVTKFKNRTSTGAKGTDPEELFVDTDFPLFRLAEMYLVYAEAVLRGGSGGTKAQAIQYINLLRRRAYGNNSGDVTDIDLNFIINERGRELYWEGHRRTDLIRFDRFTENSYLWPWKGGVKEGRGVESFRKLYPLPASDIISNPNLDQNEGY